MVGGNRLEKSSHLDPIVISIFREFEFDVFGGGCLARRELCVCGMKVDDVILSKTCPESTPFLPAAGFQALFFSLVMFLLSRSTTITVF